jgi:acylphosphatase
MLPPPAWYAHCSDLLVKQLAYGSVAQVHAYHLREKCGNAVYISHTDVASDQWNTATYKKKMMLFIGGMRRVRMIVAGKVQGVFYRNFIKQHCEKAGIKGYTKNKSDSTVEIVADVTPEQERELVKQCWKGPIMAFVKNVDVQDAESTEEFEGFDIR